MVNLMPAVVVHASCLVFILLHLNSHLPHWLLGLIATTGTQFDCLLFGQGCHVTIVSVDCGGTIFHLDVI